MLNMGSTLFYQFVESCISSLRSCKNPESFSYDLLNPFPIIFSPSEQYNKIDSDNDGDNDVSKLHSHPQVCQCLAITNYVNECLLERKCKCGHSVFSSLIQAAAGRVTLMSSGCQATPDFQGFFLLKCGWGSGFTDFLGIISFWRPS